MSEFSNVQDGDDEPLPENPFADGPFGKDFKPEVVPEEEDKPIDSVVKENLEKRLKEIDYDPNRTHTSNLMGNEPQKPWWDEKTKK